MQIKELLLSERKRELRTAKNLTNITSEDFMQLPCTCDKCDNILFRIGNLKGITANYAQYGFFELSLSDFLTSSAESNKVEQTNKFFEIWEGNIYKDILGVG